MPSSSPAPAPISCYPYGSGHGQEGVCLLLRLGPYRLLLDCGLAQLSPLIAQEENIDFAFCSHAHGDHARGLWQFHEAFPQVPIYTSSVTHQLLPLLWQDTVGGKIPAFCRPLPWRSPLFLTSDLSLEIFPAGHLPGAALVMIDYHHCDRHYRVIYTGDFSLSNLQLAEGLAMEDLRGLNPDVLIVEGTYGTARHPHRRQQEKQLMVRLVEALEGGKNLVLPVPSLGMGQEILKLLRSHHQFTGRDLDIWVEESVAQGCDRYLEILPELPTAVKNFAQHQPLFWDEKIKPRTHRFTWAQPPAWPQKPFIAIVHRDHPWPQQLPGNHRDWTVFEPQPSGPAPTTSHSLHRESYLLAEHSDGRNTLQLIHNLRPQHIVFIHGPLDWLLDLTNLEELQNRYQIHTPVAHHPLEFPLGTRFVQPAIPTKSRYEGEINELPTDILITLPDGVSQDPRWQQFADTGLVEARWQGEELVLRGLSQRELLKQNRPAETLEPFESCATCCYLQGQICQQQRSPLYGFQVSPEGYCAEFLGSGDAMA